MPNLLLICDAFQPPAYLPRLRYWCYYLRQAGWDVTLVTEQLPNQPAYTDVAATVISLPYYRQGDHIEWFWKFVLNLFVDHKGRYFSKQLLPLLNEKKIDVVLCSTFYTFPLPTAKTVSETFHVPLVADLRDIAEQAPIGSYLSHHRNNLFGRVAASIFRAVQVRRRNRVLIEANCLTTVSTWHEAFLKKINANTHLIYNGFDPDRFTETHVRTERFTLTYTGRIYYNGMQDPALFFEALSELKQAQILTSNNCVVQWYVDANSKQIVETLAAAYHVEELMQYHSFVPPSAVPDLLQRSNIILIFSNKASKKTAQGMMTTKFFEAVGVGKPVLCVRSDEGCLAQAIAESNAGIAANNKQEAKRFMEEQYRIWETQGYTASKLHPRAKQVYSRRTQAEQLELILNNSLK